MDDIVTMLRSEPRPLDVATDAVPAAPGLYAWWASAGVLPGIQGPAHPEAELELLYVGISPNGAASKATLRSRLVRNHIRGTAGQSTLRRALAALLSEHEGWGSRWTTRPVLVDEDEARLSQWMGDNLQLTWAEHPEPWTIEAGVIAELKPPLNEDDNRHHPSYEFVRTARARWRAAAKVGGN